MKICIGSYPAVTLTAGGPFIKIKEIQKHLLLAGHQVDLFDMWDQSRNLKDYDIIHLVGANFAIFGLARSLHEQGVKYLVEPVFFTRHNYKFLKRINAVDKFARKIVKGIWFDYGIIRDICTWSVLVTPNTQAEAESISKGFSIDNRKFEVIYNGVSEKFLDGDPDIFIKKYGMKDFILYVGHLGPIRKNGVALLKALAGIDHPAIIIGKIIDTGESKGILAEIKKNKNILFIDYLENDSPLLASAYSACHTFILPSQFETPGIAALEAGISGANIVITPFGGTKEYFKNMVEYPDPYSIQSIRNAVEKSINMPKNEKLKKYIKDNFLWSKISERTVEVYNKALNLS